MELALLINLCERSQNVFRIPVRIYRKNTLLLNLHPYELPVPAFEGLFSSLLEESRPLQSAATPWQQQFGLVRVKDTDIAVGVGPVCPTRVVEENVLPLLKVNGFPEKAALSMMTYLNSVPSLQASAFEELLKLLYSILNEAVYEEEGTGDAQTGETHLPETDRQLAEANEKLLNGDRSRHPGHDVEEQILFYISHGMVEKLKDANFGYAADTMGITATDTSRHLKNIVIISNTLSCRAAIRGGLPAETAYQIAEINARKIEECRTTLELEKLSKALRIDYAARVRNLLYGETNNLITTKATRFIREHIYEKITLQEIAADLGISVSYLSTKFKTDMNLSLVDYINRMKIEEAKYLLRFTDEPLSRISYNLSFSSQSYFQNIFKKYVGCTPAEYRTEGKKQN